MNLFSPTHLILVLVVVVLLFGSAKIPNLMRSLGSGVNEFKKGLAEGAAETPQAPENTPKT